MRPVGDPVRPVRPLGVLGARDPRSTRNPGQRRSEVRSSCLHRRPFGHWTGATTAGSGSVRIGRRRDPLHCLPCRDHVTVHLPACLQGRVFTTAEAEAAGVAKRHLSGRQYCSWGKGLWSCADSRPDPRTRSGLLRILPALQQEGWAASHTTAAILHDFRLPGRLGHVGGIHLCSSTGSRPRGRGVVGHQPGRAGASQAERPQHRSRAVREPSRRPQGAPGPAARGRRSGLAAGDLYAARAGGPSLHRVGG